MAQLFEIRKVTVGPRNLEAVVELAPSAPLKTAADPDGTELVLGLMPELADHVCLGDASERFGEVIADTELAHLLEHVTVELLARSDAAGDIASGQTVELAERTYKITLACPDDVLVAGALSSAVWILQWAYSGGGEPEPDIDATASGLVALVESLADTAEPAEKNREPIAESDIDAILDAPFEELTEDSEPMAPAAEPQEDATEEPAPADAEGSEDVPADDADTDATPEDPWSLRDVPRPHLVR